MYLATLGCAISNPSLSSSPWMRGAPQSGFSTLIRRINAAAPCRSASPSLGARLPAPVAAKAGPVPTHECLGPDDGENLQDRRKPAVQLDKEPAIMVGEPDATRQPTPHDIQLMSKHRVLSFKPQLRLEWRGQDGQNETEQPDHSASLGDSITSSTQIRFSVHTMRVSPLLALEIALTRRAPANRHGTARADPADERGEFALGCAAHSRRTAQAWVCDRAVERR